MATRKPTKNKGVGQGVGGGRPKKITKAWCEETAKKLPKLWEQGASMAEVCTELDICDDSYYKAMRISQKFLEAHKKGRLKCEAWWAKLGQAGSLGQVPINTGVWIFNMKNRFKWADKIEQEINSTNNNNNYEVTEEDRNEAIKRIKSRRHRKDLGNE